MSNLPDSIYNLSQSLCELEKQPGLKNAQKTATMVVNLLGISNNLGFTPLSKVPGTVANQLELAEGYADKRAAYKYNIQDTVPVDIKLYWVQKVSKKTISSLIAITPNFEDETFYVDKNIGIDVIVPHLADRLFLVLSSSYNIRLVELKGSLTNTQKEIFSKWIQISDFNNKKQVHTLLWESLDLKSLNESFYKGIAGFFSELKIHLKNTSIFDENSASCFVNRLVGRLIFCWFIRKRGLINENKKYLEISANEDSSNYYHTRLEKLFFSILNTPTDERVFEDMDTPFLNGGLFSDRVEDHKGNLSLTFPKDYFHRFFDFLNHYNFTTDESTSDYQQVAIDPEMLGRIFENLLAEQIEETGEQARKSKGAFYTPREIVDYMCRQSIKEFLKGQLLNEGGVESIISDLMDTKEHAYDKNLREKILPYKQKIEDALDSLKIIDPACGSGAFPMGMLKLLEMIYERIETRFDPHRTKIGIIKNNLYGVDIEPMAVEIARLRAWLSIIVDDDINPSLPNKGIEPLPNLDFKFVCANSLIGLDLKPKKEQLSLSGDAIGDDQLIDKLRDLRDEWFDSKDRTKKQIKDEFENVQKKLFDSVLKDWNGTASRDEKMKLINWNPFSDSQSNFFDPFWMFGIKNGFDIVIGNPPYVGEKGNKKIFKSIEKSPLYKRFYRGRMDLFYFFFHLGIDLLKEKGILVFITTNYFITATCAEKLIRDIRERTTILRMLNFGELKIFKSALGQHNIITMLQKGKKIKTAKTLITNRHGYLGQEILKSIMNGGDSETNYYSLDQDELYWENYIKLSTGRLDDILDKIKNTGKPLGSVSKVYKGITTGKDNLYIKKFSDLINLNNYDKEHLKKWYKNSDIKKYSHKQTEERIIYLTKYDTDIKKSSFIKSELEPHQNELKARKDANLRGNLKKGYWWVLATPRLEIDFDAEKIVVPQRSKENTFGYSNSEFYGSGDIYYILKDNEKYTIKLLLGILNSRLIYLWLSKRGKRKGDMLELYQVPLSQIPLPSIPSFKNNEIKLVEDLVNQIIKLKETQINSDTKKMEKEIDNLVYSLYNLSPEEINVLEEAEK